MNLLEKVESEFQKIYGGVPDIIVRAPGRVNLIGEHTDYNDGFVLPMAIDRSFWIALSPRKDGRVEVYSADLDEAEAFEIHGLSHNRGKWGEYLRGIAWYLGKFGHTLTGWNGVCAGDIPIGAGLSSSAAVELATARAFCAVSDIEWNPVEMAKVAQRTEVEWVGVNCGIMDQLISAAGISGHALLIDCRSLDFSQVPIPDGTAVVVLDTATRRGLVDSAYNERRSQCEGAAKFFGVPALRDVGMQEFEKKAEEMPDLMRKRAKHIISENERTLQAAAVMVAGDAVEMGRLMNESHKSLSDDFEVSSTALNAIVAAAQSRAECFGARMTGAGFGGCGVALIEKERAKEFTTAVSAEYQKRTGLEANLYVCQAEGGAEIVRPAGS